jgi:hypothetical protein
MPCEVVLAHFLGLKATAISVITNMAAGLGSETISHEHTKNMAPIGASKLEKILQRFCRKNPQKTRNSFFLSQKLWGELSASERGAKPLVATSTKA